MIEYLTQPVELLGLLATFTVLLSFFQRGELRIRTINIMGAALFVVYGILIGSLSVALLDSILIIVHIWKIKVLREEKRIEKIYNRELQTIKKVNEDYKREQMTKTSSK